MLAQSSGTLTFLFSDIEGSTRLWDQTPELMRVALSRHDAIMREAMEQAGGTVFKTVGDAFHVVFPAASNALSAAIAGQTGLLREEWGDLGPLRVRMGLNSGVAEMRDGDYFGPTLNRLARIRDAAYGQQILISRATADLVRDQLRGEATLLDLGEHTFRGIEAPERIFQVLHADLPRQFPPIRTQDTPVVRLPLYLNDFVGRAQILDELRALLLDESTRMLTLVGAGGAGKTRLAVEAAAAAGPRFAGGVFFAPLSGVTEASKVPGAIADALNVRKATAQPMQAVVGFLQERKALLVLDNFEQVLDAAVHILELLQSTPTAMLITSRSPLGVYGERVFEVPPMALPADSPGPVVAQLMENDAVALFVTRARAIDPRFQLNNANAASVAEICRRLDGLPLAIELAAARVKLLSPDALLERLDHRLSILTTGARDVDERQRTLRAAIDWSHNLLSDDERALFRRMAVLRGGTLEAVEAICSQGLSSPGIDLVASLVDKSLVRHVETDAGLSRLIMLETIREFATERLKESEESDRIDAGHADYFAGLAETHSARLHGPLQNESIRILEAEHENLRGAFGRFEAHDEYSAMVEMTLNLWPFWLIHGDFTEGRRSVSLALDVGRSVPVSDGVLAHLLHACGVLASVQGDEDTAHEALQSSIDTATRAGDIRRSGRARTDLGVSLLRSGDLEAAERAFEESRAELLHVEDSLGAGAAEHYLGHVALDRGDYSSAQSFWETGLAFFREIGDSWNVALPLKDLGLLKVRSGDFDGARRLYDESLEILNGTHEVWHVADLLDRLGELDLFEARFDDALSRFDDALRLYRQLADRSGVVESLNHSAEVASVQGDFARSRSLYEECLAISKDLNNRRLIAGMLHNLGNTALQTGQSGRAIELFQESLKLHHELGREAGMACALEGLAEARAAAGDMEPAAQTLGLAQSLRRKLGGTSDPFDRIEHTSGRSERLAAFGLEPELGESAPGAAQNTLALDLEKFVASLA